ncbi:Ppx/GppA family phosphatase [Frankia sp. Cpl3]|nr:Ppx/GppA phosphatase family protein [Parafrankia colletiae]MCK9899505.1 Ppx/GppA family phosphatase [Frankia sp. Cpl3]
MRLRPTLTRRGPGAGDIDLPEPPEPHWGAPAADAEIPIAAAVPVTVPVAFPVTAPEQPDAVEAGQVGELDRTSTRGASAHTHGPMRLGVIDIGSNTVHLLVVDAHRGGQPQPAASVRVPLRLVELLDGEGRLSDNGERALTDCIHELRTHAQDLNVVDLVAFATSAVREAPDGDAVLARLRADTGLSVTVLPGEAEARLTFLAVRRWLGWSAGRLLALDIGGGSLEIGAGMHEDPDVVASLPLGASRLTRNWLGENDPPKRAELSELRRYVRAQIAPVVGSLYSVGEPTRAVATSKTFRSLARIAGAEPYGRGPYVRRVLRRADLVDVTARVCRMSVAERAALPGVSVSRAGQLIAGAVVASEALDLLNLDEVEICPWALREGVILRRLDLLTSGLDGPRSLPPVAGG